MSGARALTETQVDTLELIETSPDRAVWVSDIANWTQRSISAAQQRLERLEARGLVERDTIDWDGIDVEVWTLTYSGRAVLKGVLKGYRS